MKYYVLFEYFYDDVGWAPTYEEYWSLEEAIDTTEKYKKQSMEAFPIYSVVVGPITLMSAVSSLSIEDVRKIQL